MKGRSALVLFCLFFFQSLPAVAQSDVKKGQKIIGSSDCLYVKKSKNAPAKSINLVFVPSAFQGNLELFKKQAERIWAKFSSYTPFNPDIDLINVAYVLVENKKNNFCHFNCGGIARLLCCDEKVALKLSKSCTNEARQTIVVHNSDTYGGAGYTDSNVATTSTHNESPLIAVHELGHSLFRLGDEYNYGTSTPKNARNCDTAGCKKWKDLIDVGLATCQNDSCGGGNYFSDDDTVMKTSTGNFKSVNERIACCTYRKVTGEYPNFCQMYLTLGPGLDKYCGVKVQLTK